MTNNNNNNNNNNNMDNYLICSDATLSANNNNTNEWIQFSDEQLRSIAYAAAHFLEEFSSNDLILIKVSQLSLTSSILFYVLWSLLFCFIYFLSSLLLLIILMNYSLQTLQTHSELHWSNETSG